LRKKTLTEKIKIKGDKLKKIKQYQLQLNYKVKNQYNFNERASGKKS